MPSWPVIVGGLRAHIGGTRGAHLPGRKNQAFRVAFGDGIGSCSSDDGDDRHAQAEIADAQENVEASSTWARNRQTVKDDWLVPALTPDFHRNQQSNPAHIYRGVVLRQLQPSTGDVMPLGQIKEIYLRPRSR